MEILKFVVGELLGTKSNVPESCPPLNRNLGVGEEERGPVLSPWVLTPLAHVLPTPRPELRLPWLHST